ncbi:thiamine diphosphokinase [Kiritimatiellota bacterium B12222]|nr:thiamine diphosphokinase [Kiritimatiellota bacterium B12222]
MKAILVLNGAPPAFDRIRELAKDAPVFAADGGAAVCFQAGVRPEWVAGDFDSQELSLLPDSWELKRFPEQDRTDFQKVLGALPEDITELVILGGLGRRLDHMLTNLLIAMEIPAEMKLDFEGEGCLLTRVTSRVGFHAELPVGSSLSLLPLSKVEGVSTQGLKWNLDHCDMGPGLQLGQSNEVEGEVNIALQKGCLFVWVGTP